MSLANGIDRYLAGRGSPMAGQGRAFVQAGKRYGVDPRLLVGIATIESGAGQNMRLAHNPFNWGVHRGQTYDSYGAAINDVARGLRQNYLDDGLRTPQQIVARYAPGSDGNDEGNWASVVTDVMSKLGGSGPVNPQPLRQGVIPRPPRMAAPASPPPVPVLNRQKFGNALLQQFATGGGRIDINALPGLQSQFYETPVAPKVPKAPSSPSKIPPPPTAKGGFLQLPQQWRSTHPTDGLADQGFTHAEDIMGNPGTQVGSPVAGTIMRHGSAQGGQSLWLHGNDGRVYWLGHIESDIPNGTKVKKGQVIATISADHPRPHVHIDYSTTYGR